MGVRKTAYQRLAREAELGDVVVIHHDRPTPPTIIGFVLAWIAMSALTLIVPGESLLLMVAPTIAFLAIWAMIYVMLAGERLIVCQRGILLGSVAPFLRPYAIPFDQMVPGTVVPICAKITRYAKQTGLAIMTTVRTSWWSRQGISFVGPAPDETRDPGRRRAAGAGVRPGPRSMGTPWLIGTRAPAAQATAEIARAAGAAGFTELARATAAAAPRALSGNPEDGPAQLPGVTVMRGR